MGEKGTRTQNKEWCNWATRFKLEKLAPSDLLPDITHSEHALGEFSPILVELLRVLHYFLPKIPNFDPYNPKFNPHTYTLDYKHKMYSKQQLRIKTQIHLKIII